MQNWFGQFVLGLGAGVVAMAGLLAPPPELSQRGPRPGGGCTYYWDANYAGMREQARARSTQAFVGLAWNDRVSAYRVTCR